VGIARQADPIPGWTTRPLLREHIMVALPPDHQAAADDRVPVSAIADTPLILYPKHESARFATLVLSIYRDSGFPPPVEYRTHEIQTAVALVAAGLGVTFVAESVARHGRSDVTYRSLAPQNARTTTLSAVFPTDHRAAHLDHFLDCLSENTREQNYKPADIAE
jgi:LysR family transcriptional regulator, benzoate and cis,cis-muconate-responsive activator of ben and cat genes